MYKINNTRTFDGIQIEFEDISDFYAYENRRKEKQEDYEIRGYVKSINVELLYLDQYNNGMYEWYVLNGKFLNQLEPLRLHPLEDYIDKDAPKYNPITEGLKRLDFMVSKGYVDITDWNDRREFDIIKEAIELWKEKHGNEI